MNNHKANKKALATIFLIVLMDLLGFGIILPLLPFIAEKWGANEVEIGILAATYSLFQFIASPILGKLSDRFGRKSMLIVSQLGTAAGYILLAMATNVRWLFLSRIIDGLTGGNISIAQAYIADVTDKKNRAKGMGLIGAAFGLGFIFGPAVGGLLAKISFSTPAYFSTAFALLTVICTWFFLPETVDTRKAAKSSYVQFSWKEYNRVLSTDMIRLMIGSFFILNLAQSMLQGMFALWGESTFGFGPMHIGWIFTYIGLIAVVVQLKILPWLVQKLGDRQVLKWSTLIWGIGFLLAPVVKSPIYLLGIIPLISVGTGLANPAIQAIASEKVKQEEYGETLGIVQSSGSLGRIIGPVLGGELFHIWGKNSPFLSGGILILIVFVWLQWKLNNHNQS